MSKLPPIPQDKIAESHAWRDWFNKVFISVNSVPTSTGTSGVSQIVAGTNVTITPTGGTGAVTINSTGTVGPTGPTGATGPSGSTGAIGAQGIQGIPGSAGLDGEDGIDGFSLVGPQGVQGPSGTNGTNGSNGLNGNSIVGWDGEDGLDGHTIIGPQGLQGIQGIQGPAGIQGSSGLTIIGMDGADGDDGWIGPPGPQGQAGTGGGGGGNKGLAIVDFGTGQDLATVVITGQTAILSTSTLAAHLQVFASASHSLDEHIIEEIQVRAGNIVAGVGFTVYAQTRNTAQRGVYNIGWSWL
jgi:collagen type II alpha